MKNINTLQQYRMQRDAWATEMNQHKLNLKQIVSFHMSFFQESIKDIQNLLLHQHNARLEGSLVAK